LPHRRLERGDPAHRCPARLGGVEVERDVLGREVVAARVGPADALRDDPAGAGRERGVDQVAGAGDAQRGVGGEVGRGQVGELVDHHLGGGVAHGGGQRAGVLHVHDGGLRPGRAQGGDAVGPTGERGDVVALGDEQRHEQATDDPGGPGEQDAHGHATSGRGARRCARASSSASSTRVSNGSPGSCSTTTTKRLHSSARALPAWQWVTSPPGSQNGAAARSPRSGAPSSSQTIAPSTTKPYTGPECRCGGVPGSPGGTSTVAVITSAPAGTAGSGWWASGVRIEFDDCTGGRYAKT